MDVVLDALKAPFSATAAAKTTPAKIALTYGVGCGILAVLFLK